MTSDPVRIAIFGLGEAGSAIAADLADAGAEVHGFDPAQVETPPGVIRHETPAAAASVSGLILAITAACDALQALDQALDRIEANAVYADLSTATPWLKEELAARCQSREIAFVDVALMASVPGNGLSTPSLVSGNGATRYAEVINRYGGRAEPISPVAGDAAARKLLRSVVTKGLTALLIESLEAARRRGDAEWLWRHLVEAFTDADETLLRRLIEGTPRHVDRRIVEMEAAKSFLESQEVRSHMTAATVESLRRLKREGLSLDVDADV